MNQGRQRPQLLMNEVLFWESSWNYLIYPAQTCRYLIQRAAPHLKEHADIYKMKVVVVEGSLWRHCE
jgi:hypothetical protein